MHEETTRPSAGVLRLAELPVAESRTAAYAIIRDAGPVIRDARGAYMIVSSEAAEFVLKHPGLFSSRQAFDRVGSPLPMVPIAFDPPEHTRYRRVLARPRQPGSPPGCARSARSGSPTDRARSFPRS
jgi:cytochrome P450